MLYFHFHSRNFLLFFFFIALYAMRLLVPQPGTEPKLPPVDLQWKHGILITGPPGKSQKIYFNLEKLILYF